MNPQSVVGMVMSVFGMGASLVNQGVMVHRTLNPPQVVQPVSPAILAQMSQQCQFQGKILAVVKDPTTGQPRLACVVEQR